MAALDQETERLMLKSWAPRTLRMFEVGRRSFEHFRNTRNPPAKHGPANSLEITRFISFLSIKNKAPSTIAAYVCAVSNWHKTQGWADPCKSFPVKTTLKGASKDAGAPDSRLPVTPQLLRKLIAALPTICSTPYETALFKCVFVLAFFGLFRISELVCQNKNEASSKVLLISDIAFKKDKMRVTVRFSKTDQTGKTSTMVFKSKIGENLCPVQSMKEYLPERGYHNGPLFCHVDGSYLSRFQFNKVLEKNSGMC